MAAKVYFGIFLHSEKNSCLIVIQLILSESFVEILISIFDFRKGNNFKVGWECVKISPKNSIFFIFLSDLIFCGEGHGHVSEFSTSWIPYFQENVITFYLVVKYYEGVSWTNVLAFNRSFWVYHHRVFFCECFLYFIFHFHLILQFNKLAWSSGQIP